MKRHTTSIFVLIFLFTKSIYAQFNVSGTIVNEEDSQPLIGALVKIDGVNKGRVTDVNGKFLIESKEERGTILISYLGYIERQVDFKGNTDLKTIKLRQAQTTLSEVIVSASPNTFKQDFKGSNYRISPITLAHLNPISTEEVLRMVPGVNIVGDMGISNRPNISIRGSWGRRSKKVLLLEDGTPSAPAPYIAPGAYYNPVSDRIKSIEVYKGADLLRYGPNNMYGGINYITALPPQKPELRIKLIGGQRNYQTGLLSYGGKWKNLGALVEGVYKKFDGFIDNSSVQVINLNSKIFAQLSENQSLYFKLSGQFEDNQASLSSQTPFTFEADPTQNPLDADQFTMRRYGADIIHKWIPEERISITSKIYASDFERDWWRQVTQKIKASDAKSYLSESIYNDRYAYLEDQTFGEEDYLIVGKVDNGIESTTDSRWTYTVSGIKETATLKWDAFDTSQNLEVGLNIHQETFKDRFLEADSSRWARHGTIVKDLWYRLWSINGHIRNEFNIKKWTITPIVRFEHVDMFRQDLIAAANNTQSTGIDEGLEYNIYNQVLPGLTLEYREKNHEFYGSVYQGMIAPSKVFGFLVEQDGKITNPLAGLSINIAPELSWNKEIGWRGSIMNDRISSQVTYFNNTSKNFYAGGRNEVFEQLGRINVQGIEGSLSALVLKEKQHRLRVRGNVNLMHSKVLEGKLVDKDLFSQVIHSSSTKQEYIDKVNENREAFEVYTINSVGNEELLVKDNLEVSDFDNISKSVLTFGENGIKNAESPYTPSINLNLSFNYSYANLNVGVSGNYVGTQYTEFHNFTNESADGAIGELPAYHSFDCYVNYKLKLKANYDVELFFNGKNITNEIYRASRLNRATSGVFGGGFRQLMIGANFVL